MTFGGGHILKYFNYTINNGSLLGVDYQGTSTPYVFMFLYCLNFFNHLYHICNLTNVYVRIYLNPSETLFLSLKRV